MTGPQVLLLNDRQGIDVSTASTCCATWRPGTGILFYSTDYEELIGCCDRVAMLYDGHVVAGTSASQRTCAHQRAQPGTSRAVAAKRMALS